MLQTENLCVRYGGLSIVDHVNFSVEEQQWLMVVGPNGAGKSTLVSAISRGVDYSGTVRFHGRDIRRFRPTELARQMGILMQNHHVGYSFTVEEVVRLGRYAYTQGIFSRGAGDEDQRKVDDALELTGMTAMRGQSVLTLSGGELQRTFLAQLLAQNPKLLILDEPSNHLDLIYQRQVFGLIRQWLEIPGRAVISVVHDLSLAKTYGTHALLMDQGRQVVIGPVARVLNSEHLQAVYHMDVYAWMQAMLSQWRDTSERGEG